MADGVHPAAAQPRLKLAPLIVANAVCMMAMMAFVALLGPLVRALGLSEWQAGATVTTAGVLWFLLARSWGRLSDRIGRKRVLVIGVAGFAASYLVLAAGLDWALAATPGAAASFALLLLGRGTAGAFYAAVPASANAMIADRTTGAERAPAMAAVGAAGAVGMVLGPAIAGLLVVRGLAVPLYAMAVLPVLALLLIAFGLARGGTHRRQDQPPPRLLDPRLRLPVLVAFSAMGAVSIAQICVGFYSLDRLGLSAEAGGRVAGYALTAVGVALISAQLLVRRLGWPPLRLIARGLALAALGLLCAGLSTQAWMLVGAYFVCAFGMGFVFPAFSAAAANAVEAHEQGVVAGTVSAAQGMGMVLGPLVGGALYALSPTVPYLLAAAALLGMAAWVRGRAPGTP